MERRRTAVAFRMLTSGVAAVCAVLVGVLFHMAPALARQAGPQAAPAAPAAQAAGANACAEGQDLVTIPEIKSSPDGRLRAEIRLTSGKRTLWGSVGDSRCREQDLRYFTGRNLMTAVPDDPAFAKGDPIPGPTLRARVGDLIEIKFLNRVDTQAFANSLDQESNSSTNTTGCDEVRTNTGLIYPNAGPGGDVMPNCLHGSSTSNIHFHGTHTTPNTTGDNILLFVRPAQKDGNSYKPDDRFIDRQFEQIWSRCEKDGSPTRWEQLPEAWRKDQEKLIKYYDRTAPYRGEPGKLPHHAQLWPVNQGEIAAGYWPQYQLGAYPYCFRIPEYKEVDGKPSGVTMGQSPGTHWYHAHKHGSTALNVANGMTGAFIIEGQYDDDLRKFYGVGFKQQVLVVQQLSSQPFPVLDATRYNQGPGAPKPKMSVNGRLNPVVRMKPGEVQLWRIVNASYRSAVQLVNFTGPAPMTWRQVAQDGVQFKFENYNGLGAPNTSLNMAPANRADLLVKAPTQAGTYQLAAQPNEGLTLDPSATFIPKDPGITLLTVVVEGAPLTPPQDFIQNASDFPKFPNFLNDIQAAEIHNRREMLFGAVHNLIDGKTFDPNKVNQAMLLNSAEEWKVMNAAIDKAHPFHIHINPFQITEVFEPNKVTNFTQPTQPCYVNPANPETWKPCRAFTGPFVWWDNFAIPTAHVQTLDSTVCTTVTACPESIQKNTSCTGGVCKVTIPGYFKMRSRFVDYTGAYVIHCHILIHEDRGMMQLVEVVSDKSTYIHQ